jgi:serine/threonine protein phosphatase 1
MFLRACGSLDHLRLWILNGGHTTLSSFNREDPCDIPVSYRRFMHDLPYYVVLDDYILVHAGLNFEREDPFTDTEAMLWSRSCDVDLVRLSGKKVISGHTPVMRETIKKSILTNRILLDNGCVYAGNPELGTLAALELGSLSLYFQKNID